MKTTYISILLTLLTLFTAHAGPSSPFGKKASKEMKELAKEFLVEYNKDNGNYDGVALAIRQQFFEEYREFCVKNPKYDDIALNCASPLASHIAETGRIPEQQWWSQFLDME